MEAVFIVSSLIVAISFFFIWYITTYNRFQDFIIRINESEAIIDSVLRKRFDLLNKSINIIKANAEIDGDILESIVKLRARKLSNFDLDRQLYDAINEFNGYKENYKELNIIDSFVKIDLSLIETEVELSSSRNYYNDVITDYNKAVKSFPSNFIAKFCKYKYRPYFDGKDMSDEIRNDFKL